MNKKISITFCCMLLANLLPAQTISMYFPAFAGKTYELVIFQGTRSIKAQQNTIPANGRFELKIPGEYAPYTGMCRWLLTNSTEGGGLDMAIPGHGFSVRCTSARPDNTNITYEGYDPVNGLNHLNAQQQSIIDKYQAMSRAAKLYGKGSVLYPVFEKEMEAQRQAFDDFSSALKQNINYAARFLLIVNITRGVPPHLSADYNSASEDIADHIANHLDMDNLYTSGHWPAVLDTWVQIEVNVIENDKELVSTFNKMGDRITDPVKYTDFVKCVTRSLTRYGKDKQIALLQPFVVSSGKIVDYLGGLSVYQDKMIGKQAPALVIAEHVGAVADLSRQTTTWQSSELATGGHSKTLLVFYESGCGPCEELMLQLPGNYELLERKGVRIIAIAADTDEETFKNRSYDFPWNDTYCDFKGIGGPNFIHYAVTGTPTAFLINKDGKIMAKMATMQNILEQLK